MVVCEQCEVNIDPAWVKVIKENVCPGCGGEIISSERKELLDELTNAIAEMDHDPAGLAGWLMSNFTMEKIVDGVVQPTMFYSNLRKKKHLYDPENEIPGSENDLPINFRDRSKMKDFGKLSQIINGNEKFMSMNGKQDKKAIKDFIQNKMNMSGGGASIEEFEKYQALQDLENLDYNSYDGQDNYADSSYEENTLTGIPQLDIINNKRREDSQIASRLRAGR